MKLDDVTVGVRKGHRACQSVHGADHGRLDAFFTQRVLKQPIEVRGDDDANELITHQLGDRPMRLRRGLAAFLNIFRRRLDVAMKDCPTFVRGSRQAVE